MRMLKRMTAQIIDINDRHSEDGVTRCNLPVAVDFWIPWCQPRRIIAPATEKLAKEYKGRFKFCTLNVDESR